MGSVRKICSVGALLGLAMTGFGATAQVTVQPSVSRTPMGLDTLRTPPAGARRSNQPASTLAEPVRSGDNLVGGIQTRVRP
jgi:hypothetical protein